MAAYMKHLVGPYGAKGTPAMLSRVVIEALAYEKWWRDALKRAEKDVEMQAIREGRWTTWVGRL